MEVTLNRAEIDEAIALANATFAKWENRPGYYPNQYNSHIKGKLGEIAIEKMLKARSISHTSHFRNAKAQGLCDIEMLSSHRHPRLEIKIWSLEHWKEQGRCITPAQLPKLQLLADVVVWCVVDLQKVYTPSDIASLKDLTIRIAGWSTINEVAATNPRLTGWRKINNHQVEEDDLSPFESLVHV